ncbi:nucleoside hydrolase [Virgibacillus halophilus]|uniref:Nucleoside hydrolase n=1 Tax=Tigheibacillus halophilus TaxID=361280 RepID=A0ABU5C974_9BACI|nr:nucleoside hydrolase [Virgibacillus halophilus]
MKGTKYYNFIFQSTNQYREYSKLHYGRDGCALHDPLTCDPTLVKTARYYVDVETKSDLSYGQTICDFRNNWQKPSVEICLDVENERFINSFIDTLQK